MLFRVDGEPVAVKGGCTDCGGTCKEVVPVPEKVMKEVESHTDALKDVLTDELFAKLKNKTKGAKKKGGGLLYV